MRKIISLFQRNYDTDHRVRNEVVPGAEWVLAGEGLATRKLDGTCCLIRDGKLYKRYEVKPGVKPPVNFESANEIDELTGKQQGWIPVGDGKEDKWHREAFESLVAVSGFNRAYGTYELVGTKIQGDPEHWGCHALIAHRSLGLRLIEDCPRDFDGIREYLQTRDIE